MRILASLGVSCLLISGCATIYTDSTQSVTFITTCNGSTKVVPAQCTLVTPRGTQRLTTPGVVELARTDSRVSIECDSAASGLGRAELKSSSNLSWTGNFAPFIGGIAGGIVGGVVDSVSGASQEFPKSITISLACVSPVSQSE